MQDIQIPPRTIMEVFKMLPQGTLAELINGSIYMSPAPNTKHQRVVRELILELSTYVKKNKTGEILFAPFDVFLDEVSNAVQPDIIFVSSEKSAIVGDDAIHGVPDMLIEVLSPGNSHHDFVRKKELYQKFGVGEYWIINPDTKESIGFTLTDGMYSEAGRFSAKIKPVLFVREFEF